MYIDTHTHLYDEKLVADPQQIPRAIAAGVTRMFMPNCDSETIPGMLALADQWPDNCFPMMGLHPTYVKENYKDELAIVADWLAKRKFWAVGEIGLDYYWDVTFKEQQKEAFAYQIDLALQYDIPIVIHSRNAEQDCIDIVRSKQNGKLTGVFHCFSGTTEQAEQIADLGFYIGVGGSLTYKKNTLPETLREVGIKNVVLETDAPYLAPIPHRGKRNESSYIPLVAVKIAEVTGIPYLDVADITTNNANKLFKMKP